MPDIENLLQQALERLLKIREPRLDNTPARLRESIGYSLMGPGKRIRPRLALASSKLFELSDGAAHAAAIAIEMVHCYTLIHDDLPCMDNDDFRRGRPSNHKKFDEATALLAGDSLMALALDALLEARNAGVAADAVLAATKRLVLAMGPTGVIAGQAMESTLHAGSTLADLTLMHQLKTGALFSAALLLPADLAGIPHGSKEAQCLIVFAESLGAAFQVADDLEDAGQDKTQRTPANIVHYLSPNEARERSIRSLQDSKNALESQWPQRAQVLVQIADEVLEKLERS